jgi:hypothetical protein
MASSKYTCPLCNQPVSSSLFMQITGIWKAKEKELAKVKTERANLKKMQKEFKIQKAKLIKSAVAKKASQYEAKMQILKTREKKIQSQAEKKITSVLEKAHATEEKKTRQYEAKMQILKTREQKIRSQAEKKISIALEKAHTTEQLKFKSRELKLKKELENSLKKEGKAIKLRVMSDAKVKYKQVERSLKSTISQFKGENSRLSKRNKLLDENIQRLEKQLAEKATPQIEGLLYEKELMKQLQKRFKEDKFVNTGKGGDIIQSVVNDKEIVGTIVYECKRVKNYVSKHINQIYDAQNKRKAEFGILVTNAMKKGTNGFFVEKGVIIVHSTGVLYVASILRKQIVQISDMKLGQMEREKAVKNTLTYLESSEFSNSVGSIIQDSVSLYNELVNEVKRHYKAWKERYVLYSRINSEANSIQGTTKALLSGKEVEEKKVSMLPALVELPKVSDEAQS